MPSNIIAFPSHKAAKETPLRPLQDPSLDRGEATPENSNPIEITAQTVEKTANEVQTKGKVFRQTDLADDEALFKGKKRHHRDEKMISVQDPPLFEKPEELDKRVREKTVLIFEQLLSDMCSTRQRFPQLVGEIVHTLQNKDVTTQKSKLEECQKKLEELIESLRGIATQYFARGVRLLREFERVYPAGFDEIIISLVHEYYLRFGHQTDHETQPEQFAEVLIFDIVQMSSDERLDKTLEDVERLTQIIDSNESSNEKVVGFAKLKKQEEMQGIQDRLADTHETLTEETSIKAQISASEKNADQQQKVA